MFCSKCGTANVEANLVCASCGNSLKPTASVSPVVATSRQKTSLLLGIVALVCLGGWVANITIRNITDLTDAFANGMPGAASSIYDDSKGCLVLGDRGTSPWNGAVPTTTASDVDCPGFGVFVDFQTGELDQGNTHSIVGAVPAGDYIVTARCDDDCTDLDLAVSQENGSFLDYDYDPDYFPTVRFSATTGEAIIDITVTMVECSVEPCGFLVAIKAR